MQNKIREYLCAHIKRKVIIYGQIEVVQECLTDLEDNYDLYYMDLEAENAENSGYLSLKQAAQMHIDYILLVKQMIFRQDLFQQLLTFCEQYKVPLIDAKGRRIDLICGDAEKYVYPSKDEIMKEIQSHTCISFDIFDTLLTRKTLFPEDIWEITEREAQKQGGNITEFVAKRLTAQEELGLSNPNIEDIYNNLCKKYSVSKEEADIYKALEIKVEEEQLIVRQDMLDMFYECTKSGKKTFLVSDMYLPEKVIEHILKEKGITGYDSLYVSCDREQLKIQGLLESYKAEQGDNQFLHIGDHVVHDGVCAALAGIDYCLIPSPLTMARRTTLRNVISLANSLSERYMLGLIISRAMNSPFKKGWSEGIIAVDTEYEYGYVFCAALIIRFVLWMIEKIKNDSYDKILFAARDGYVLQQMYELIRKSDNDELPPSLYFYTSRKAAVMTSIKNEAYINMIIQISAGMQPETIMRERFGLKQAEIKEYDESIYGDSIHKYVWDHVEAILKRSDEAKRNYFRYMGSEKLEIGKTYAFIDFVSSGTTQKSLMQIAPFDLRGLYMGWNGSDDRESVNVDAMFENNTSYFMRHFKIMETFMTSGEPSVSCFDKEGKPVFSCQDRSGRELRYIEDVQRACKDLFQEVLLLQDWHDIELGINFTDQIFAVRESADIIKPDSVLNELTLMDDWKQEKNRIEELIK